MAALRHDPLTPQAHVLSTHARQSIGGRAGAPPVPSPGRSIVTSSGDEADLRAIMGAWDELGRR